MSAERHTETALTAVIEPGAPAHDASDRHVTATPESATSAPETLELHGPLGPGLVETALSRLAADRPALRARRPRLLRRGPERHTLEPDGPYPLGALADLLTALSAAEPPETLGVTPLQRELLADAVDRPHHQIAQFLWRWHGPLDTGRFTAAWQAVFDHETVLRSAFVWDPQPRLALHTRARPDVVRHRHGTVTRRALMEQERRRGFDLGRPGLLRAALLDGSPPEPDDGGTPPTDVLLTYHRGLLDTLSVRILLREFYRAYLDAGHLQGGERRPDLRDYHRWLGGQDPAPARDFWDRAARPAAAALPRAEPGDATGRHGTGRVRARLSRTEAARLTDWAARWGVTESGALQAVWAMLLYRAGGASGPAPVGFSVTVSGRGIPMEGIGRVPGPFENPLPMTLRVDPAATVAGLLQQARDWALDMAAYEWVSAGQVRGWRGGTRAADPDPPGMLLSFTQRFPAMDTLADELEGQGIHMEDLDPAGPQTAFPVGVVAHYDSTGGLVLTSVHDRALVVDDEVSALLAQSARLLRELPVGANESTTVAEALAELPDIDVPRLHERPSGPAAPGAEAFAPVRLVRLRAVARPGAGTVCLVTPPGTPDGSHTELARHYTGPHAVVALRADPDRMPGCLAALRPLLAAGGPLVLGGFSGAGAVAHELARRVGEERSGRTPPVVLGAGPATGGPAAARALARALAATARRGR